MSLKEDLRSMDPVKRIKYVNALKQGAEHEEYQELIKIELEELKTNLDAQLLKLTESERITLLAGRLQGVAMVYNVLFGLWPDPEPEPTQEEDDD